MTGERWGVVGGGMLGMSLALWLRERGNDVTIIEAAEELGGLASVWQIGDITWDRHYHVILNSDAHLLSLLNRIGLAEELRWVETRTGVYSGGKLYSVSNALEYLRFPPLRMIDKARMAWTIIYGSRITNWRRLELEPVETWLRRHSGNRAYESFWLPLLKSKLGENHHQTSAAFIWTTIQRLYAARRSGLKKEMFGYVAGGYARIIARLAATLDDAGVVTLLGKRVVQIHSDGTGVAVDVGDAEHSFDKVVVTAAAPLASRLVPDLDRREVDLMRGVEYQGIVCASMLSSKGLGGFYVTNITDPAPFTGVIEMSALVDKAELGGSHLTYLPRYTVPDDPITQMSDEDLERIFVGAVTEMFPGFGPSDVMDFRVSRVPFVLPIPTIRYSERVPPMRTSVPGVFTVNSSQILNGTLNVDETLQLAARALPILTGESDFSPVTLEAEVSPVLAPT